MPPEDCSEFVNAGVPSMFFRVGVYEPERVAAAGEGSQLPGNHSPVPKPTLKPALSPLAVLGVFDQHAGGK
jgi:hypothetical protein